MILLALNKNVSVIYITYKPICTPLEMSVILETSPLAPRTGSSVSAPKHHVSLVLFEGEDTRTGVGDKG